MNILLVLTLFRSVFVQLVNARNKIAFFCCAELTPEHQKILIDIRRKKTELLLEIQVSQLSYFSCSLFPRYIVPNMMSREKEFFYPFILFNNETSETFLSFCSTFTLSMNVPYQSLVCTVFSRCCHHNLKCLQAEMFDGKIFRAIFAILPFGV